MATRGAENAKPLLGGSTQFQIHVSQRVNAPEGRPLDFSEHRIKWMHAMETDPTKKLKLSALLADYKLGYVAVAFREGELEFLKVTRDVK